MRYSLGIYSRIPKPTASMLWGIVWRFSIAVLLFTGTTIGSYFSGSQHQKNHNWDGTFNLSVSEETAHTLNDAFYERQAASLVIWGIDYRVPNFIPLKGYPVTPFATKYLSRAESSRFISYMRSECYTAIIEVSVHETSTEISCPIQGKLSIPYGAIIMILNRKPNQSEINDIQDQLWGLGQSTLNNP